MKFIECPYKDFSVTTYADLAEHLLVHDRPHIKPQSFNSFRYTSRIWNLDLSISRILYDEYLKMTCRNVPCMECIYRGIFATMPHKKLELALMNMHGRVEYNKHGKPKIPRQILTPRSLNVGNIPT